MGILCHEWAWRAINWTSCTCDFWAHVNINITLLIDWLIDRSIDRSMLMARLICTATACYQCCHVRAPEAVAFVRTDPIRFLVICRMIKPEKIWFCLGVSCVYLEYCRSALSEAKWLAGKTRHRSDLLCVEWRGTLNSIHSLTVLTHTISASFKFHLIIFEIVGGVELSLHAAGTKVDTLYN